MLRRGVLQTSTNDRRRRQTPATVCPLHYVGGPVIRILLQNYNCYSGASRVHHYRSVVVLYLARYMLWSCVCLPQSGIVLKWLKITQTTLYNSPGTFDPWWRRSTLQTTNNHWNGMVEATWPILNFGAPIICMERLILCI